MNKIYAGTSPFFVIVLVILLVHNAPGLGPILSSSNPLTSNFELFAILSEDFKADGMLLIVFVSFFPFNLA